MRIEAEWNEWVRCGTILTGRTSGDDGGVSDQEGECEFEGMVRVYSVRLDDELYTGWDCPSCGESNDIDEFAGSEF